MIMEAIVVAHPTWNLTLLAAMAILRAIERLLSRCVRLETRKSIGQWLCQTSWELTKHPAPLTWENKVIKSLISAMSFSRKDSDPSSPSTRTLEYRKILSCLNSYWRRIRPNSQHCFSMSLVKPQSRWFNSQESSRLRIRKFSTTRMPHPRLSSRPRIKIKLSQAIMSKGRKTLKILPILKWTQQCKTWMCTLKTKTNKKSKYLESWLKRNSLSPMQGEQANSPMPPQPTFLQLSRNIGTYAKNQSLKR